MIELNGRENKKKRYREESWGALRKLYEERCLAVTFIYIHKQKSLLVFQSTQNEVVRFIQVIFYPRGKKLSVLTRCPLYSVRFMEVFLCEFIGKTAGNLGFCSS